MSDKPISVGDLVVLVRGHECAIKKAAGIPFTVTAILAPMGGGWHCPVCHKDSAGGNEPAAEGFRNIKNHGLPISWLKRIPPMSELERQSTQEDMKEPA